jgi:hypothetical protein
MGASCTSVKPSNQIIRSKSDSSLLKLKEDALPILRHIDTLLGQPERAKVDGNARIQLNKAIDDLMTARSPEKLMDLTTYELSELLSTFEDLRPHLQEFKQRYENGAMTERMQDVEAVKRNVINLMSVKSSVDASVYADLPAIKDMFQSIKNGNLTLEDGAKVIAAFATLSDKRNYPLSKKFTVEEREEVRHKLYLKARGNPDQVFALAKEFTDWLDLASPQIPLDAKFV